jgi:type VI secretion system secreted protein Hcp
VPAECATPLPNPADSQPAAFLKVQGVTGESRNARDAGESEVDSFRFGASKPGDAGQAVPRTFVIGKTFDKASPQLLTRLANGRHMASVVLTQDKPAGTFLRYTLSDVQVVDYEHTGRVARNAERICLRFARAEVEYLPQQPDGSLGTAVRGAIER